MHDFSQDSIENGQDLLQFKIDWTSQIQNMWEGAGVTYIEVDDGLVWT